MDLERSFNLYSGKPEEWLFGVSPQDIANFRTRDPLFDELVEDYLTISRSLLHLMQAQKSQSVTDSQFSSDLLETLHSLEAEIKNHLSQAAQPTEKDTK